jgi:hypothetical protein
VPAEACTPAGGINVIHKSSIFLVCLLAFAIIARADDDAKPKVAVFPLAGTATQDQRDKVGFSLRMKLDRDGHFEAIDGPTMIDLASGGDKPVDLSTPPAALISMSKEESPVILIWGELDAVGSGFDLKVKTLDLRQKDAKPTDLEKPIRQPTDLRFVSEQILETIKGVGTFSHPVENEVTDDPKSLELWKQNPNLVPDGDFAAEGKWIALLRSEKYPAPISDSLPGVDKVVIYKKASAGDGADDDDPATSVKGNVLAMHLSKGVAESNGLACLSAPMDIEPNTRYRIQFRYKSDGPTLHVFVKGYIKGKNIAGEMDDVQDYECQVPPSGATHGQWRTVVCDLNPQNPSGSPKFLKVDLYTYLSPGRVMFSDVQLKAVGSQTRHAVDDAIKPPNP